MNIRTSYSTSHQPVYLCQQYGILNSKVRLTLCCNNQMLGFPATKKVQNRSTMSVGCFLALKISWANSHLWVGCRRPACSNYHIKKKFFNSLSYHSRLKMSLALHQCKVNPKGLKIVSSNCCAKSHTKLDVEPTLRDFLIF